ncbi:MAG: 3-oxoacyl-ACP reductase FabG [Kiritimatiellae bacterium]|jgi:3-oxoacyl-[acyl-carrier protein] reductase|nr:3-oxoacyl-ACP reductase FabG [Kiritimatiellia bacterium]
MKTALVTGAAKGIGKAIAIALAKDGFNVAVHYHSSQTEALKTVAEIKSAGGNATAFMADLNEPDQITALVKEVTETCGPIHTLVCNAGVMHSQLLAFTTFKDWRAVMSANLDAAFLLTKALSRLMARQRAGRIIYISSDAALLGDLMRCAYSASKAGLLGLARTAAREMAASGITVNTITPGIIETDMTADIPETRRVKQLASIPMNRFGKPEEIAGAVRFLASDDAAWITGQTISIDGGLCMR